MCVFSILQFKCFFLISINLKWHALAVLFECFKNKVSLADEAIGSAEYLVGLSLSEVGLECIAELFWVLDEFTLSNV